MRARLTIPAGKQTGNRVRIGIAIEAPDTSAFFNDLHRLVIGTQEHRVHGVLLRGGGGTFPPAPARGLHGRPHHQIAQRNRLRNLRPRRRPARRFRQSCASKPMASRSAARASNSSAPPPSACSPAMQFHFGPQDRADARTARRRHRSQGRRQSRNLDFATTHRRSRPTTWNPPAQGLEFLPPKTDISIGPTDERRVEFRVFAAEGHRRPARLECSRVTDGADLTHADAAGAGAPRPHRRRGAPIWMPTASPEWILESAKVRAVFSTQDGGRWMEFTWKDTNTNFLPENGIFAQAGPVEVRQTANWAGIQRAEAGSAPSRLNGDVAHR